MPGILVASGEGLRTRSAIMYSKVEHNHAIAALGILCHIDGCIGRRGVCGTVPGIAFARINNLNIRGTSVDCEMEGVDIGAVVTRHVIIVSIGSRSSVVVAIP